MPFQSRKDLNQLHSKGLALDGVQYVDEFGVSYVGLPNGRLDRIGGSRTRTIAPPTVVTPTTTATTTTTTTPTGGSVVTGSYICGETINGGATVVLLGNLLYNYDIKDNSHYGALIGISAQAGLITDTINVTLSGYNNQVGGLATGIVFAADPPGTLSNTAPVTGQMQIVGVAQSATEIIVDLKDIFILI